MTLYGWDKSHYDGAGGNAKAVSEGFRFITHKAGGDANDAELAEWWNDARKIKPADCLLGAYWVLYPGRPGARADEFLDRLDRHCKGWRDRPFMLQVDCEIWGGKASTLPSRADVEAFCDRLHARMPKLRPIVYGPKWCYGNKLAGLNYPLWASSYVTGSGYASKLYPGDSSRRWAAYSGMTPAILQFTSKAVIAGQTTCDANAFRGTLAQLTALVAPGWVPATRPGPTPKPTPTTRPTPVPAPGGDMELSDKVGSPAYAGRTVGNVLNDLEGLRDLLIGDAIGAEFSGLKDGSPLARLIGVPDQVDALGRSLTSAITALGAKDHVDEAALAGAIAPGVAAIVVEEVMTALKNGGDDMADPPVNLSDLITAAVRDALSGADADELTALQREVAQSRINA